MDNKGFPYTTVIEDVQRSFNLQTVKPYIRRKMDSFDWTSYYSLKDIYDWYLDLEKSYPNEVTILHLGKTEEMREILCLKVSLRGSQEKRSAVVVEGGVHGKEWISPAVVTYFLDQLLKSLCNKETDMYKIANKYEFYFIPVLNPDGYEYSMKQDRMWRKNRKGGYGVDINGNFAYNFGTNLTYHNVHDKKDKFYCGPHEFSEKESQAMRKIIEIDACSVEFYMAFHSYGQYLIIPEENPKEYEENERVVYILHQAQNKIQERYKSKYTIGTYEETVVNVPGLYPGGSASWVKNAFKVP
ncbi:hypothetical protein O0L34_g1086 [Tuta absoluta]|nr:hypothetical protein O0L34_g1086 [Tuta absoluta]